MTNVRIMIAEAVGTAILMLGGPGVAVLAAGTGALGEAAMLAVALGFGFSLLIAAYAIGHISGCHINPAVTLGLWIMKKIDTAKVPAYLIGQLLGAFVGGGLIWVVRTGAADDFTAEEANFAANLWDSGHGFFGFWPMVVAEVVLTALLVLMVLSTTRKGYNPATVGLHVGITLTLIHLISIPVDNTSVNPARSIGAAVFAGGAALEQLWAFVVFPLLGAGVGALLWLLIDDAELEDTALAGTGMGAALIGARGAVGNVTDRMNLMGAGGDDPSAHPYGVGSRAPLADRSMPEGFPIKGNVDSMLYHRADSRNYGATNAEVWFDTPARAEAAGFKLAATHPR